MVVGGDLRVLGNVYITVITTYYIMLCLVSLFVCVLVINKVMVHSFIRLEVVEQRARVSVFSFVPWEADVFSCRYCNTCMRSYNRTYKYKGEVIHS